MGRADMECASTGAPIVATGKCAANSGSAGGLYSAVKRTSGNVADGLGWFALPGAELEERLKASRSDARALRGRRDAVQPGNTAKGAPALAPSPMHQPPPAPSKQASPIPTCPSHRTARASGDRYGDW